MNKGPKFFIRALQTRLPFLQDLRYQFQFGLRALRQQTHDPDFDALGLLKKGKERVFLDIGSNRGEAIQSMLIGYEGASTIIGFEPNPLIFDKLQRTHGHRENVVLHECGLGDQPSRFSLFIPFYRQWMFDGLASFKREAAASWLVHRLWNFREKLLTIREEVCTVKRLDDFQLAPDFIKIDVQGFELQVLQGGVETLRSHQPTLLIESIQPDLMDFLRGLGYRFYRFENGRFEEGKGSLNTFCMTERGRVDFGLSDAKQQVPTKLVA